MIYIFFHQAFGFIWKIYFKAKLNLKGDNCSFPQVCKTKKSFKPA